MSKPAPVPTSPAPSKGKVFLRRLTSTAILWSIVLGAMFSGNKVLSNGVFLVIMLVLAGVGLIEFYGLVEKRGLVCFKKWGIFCGLVLMVGTFLHFSGILGIA